MLHILFKVATSYGVEVKYMRHKWWKEKEYQTLVPNSLVKYNEMELCFIFFLVLICSSKEPLLWKSTILTDLVKI